MSICAVILAGGSGSRLWPLSSTRYPKQFLSLYEENTMLQATVRRAELLGAESNIVICSESHRFIVAEQLKAIGSSAEIILEPMGRSTAPAVALAAMATDPGSTLLVLPADHVINDDKAFSESVEYARGFADTGRLVTFGVIPTSPNSEYGYIKTGAAIGPGFEVDRFVEKPRKALAEEYLKEGGYLWNSGMFVFQVESYIDQLMEHRPDIFSFAREAFEHSVVDIDFRRLDGSIFENCPNESIDIAVMEKTRVSAVVPIDVGWDDLGSWRSLAAITEKDESGNSLLGEVVTKDVRNTYLKADKKPIVAIGIDELVVVDTPDALLVAHKDKVHDVKSVHEQARREGISEPKLYSRHYRPWGYYETINMGKRHQVKLISVNPRGKLSVQLHKFRSEHWVVVSGVARVTMGDSEFLLAEDQSTYIPIEKVHCLENPGESVLELVEVQSGSYLGEDDIVRFEDIYGRV